MNAGLNLCIGWIAILVGLIAGAGIGVLFHREDWLGGYASWPRRMVRLGHISFLGTGLLNLAFAGTLRLASGDLQLPVASALLAASTVAMPAVCFLSAWHKPLRHLFFIPVGCMIGGVGELVLRGWLL